FVSRESGGWALPASRPAARRSAPTRWRERGIPVYEAFFSRGRKLGARLSTGRSFAARREWKPAGRRDLPPRQRGTGTVPHAVVVARGFCGWRRVRGTPAGLSRE